MTNESYRNLEKAKIIKSHKVDKKTFESIDPILYAVDDADINGYWVYDEIENEEELKLLLSIKQASDTRSIKLMLTYFTVISVLSLICGSIAVLPLLK